jgi:2-octaprenyl-6-methoxyphenol hydroxylase
MLLPKSEVQNYDLVIVGGGIVGLTLAAALKNAGLSLALVEAQSLEQNLNRRQAYALSILSGRIFAGLGIWEKLKPQLGKFSRIRLSDADYEKFVTFDVSELGTEFLGYVAEHRVLLTSLEHYLRDAANIQMLCPEVVKEVTYTPDTATVKLETGLTLQTRLVVAADGARSPIRQAAGIKTFGWRYWQSCVTFTVAHQAPRNDLALERFWPTGPMGILPLPGNRCQIVWTAPHPEAQTLLSLPEADFLAKLQTYSGGLLGKLELVSDRRLFPVQLLQSQTYIKPRLALIGDAAHCCHPVGGQGLNLGLRDAAALAEVLLDTHQRGADIGTLAHLQPYERWRKRENLAILGFTDFLDRLFSNQFWPVVALRRLGLGLLIYVLPLKRLALQLMTGLLGQVPRLAQR